MDKDVKNCRHLFGFTTLLIAFSIYLPACGDQSLGEDESTRKKTVISIEVQEGDGSNDTSQTPDKDLDEETVAVEPQVISGANLTCQHLSLEAIKKVDPNSEKGTYIGCSIANLDQSSGSLHLVGNQQQFDPKILKRFTTKLYDNANKEIAHIMLSIKVDTFDFILHTKQNIEDTYSVKVFKDGKLFASGSWQMVKEFLEKNDSLQEIIDKANELDQDK